MKKIPFVKMHGAGNDFVFLSKDQFKGKITPALARTLLDRHFGIGGDQLIYLSAGKKGLPRLAFYNSDGSQAEMCGNGTRAAAAYLRDYKGFRKNFSFQTQTRRIGIQLIGRTVAVDMGAPAIGGDRVLSVAGKKFSIQRVSMGNPHCVIFVKNVATFPVREIGPLIENHPLFPKRTNVEFVQVLSRSRVKARVWERGAGETLACGTGACAIAVAAARVSKTGRSVKIDLPGGQLTARWAADNHVYLSGPTAIPYSGVFNLK